MYVLFVHCMAPAATLRGGGGGRTRGKGREGHAQVAVGPGWPSGSRGVAVVRAGPKTG